MLRDDCADINLQQGQHMYESRIVAFIDILGFKDAIKVESRAKEIYEALTEIKTKITEYYEDPERKRFEGILDIELSAFSDSVVISGSEQQAVCVLLASLDFSQKLVGCGFLCRGAIACGKLHHKDGILFGDGYIEACLREKHQAIYPRIVIDSKASDLLKDSKNDPDDFNGLIRIDKDGHSFINILYEIHETSPDLQKKLSALVCTQLAQNCFIDHAIKQKLMWLKNEYQLRDDNYSHYPGATNH